MQCSASISHFSIESADCPVVPASPKPLGKLGKLLGLKIDPSTSNDKYHTTCLQLNNAQSLAFESQILKSASFYSGPENTTNDNIGPLMDTPHPRSLNHSVSSPAMHASTLRQKRIPSMRAHRSSVSDGLSRGNNGPRLLPIRRQPEISADVPQMIPEKKSRWTWKGRAFIPKRSRSPPPTTEEKNIGEAPTNSNITDVSTPQCQAPVVAEAQIPDIRPSSRPSSPTLDDLYLTPISTRSSEHEQPTGHKPQRSRGSINKVSRTLGIPEITFATEFGEVPLSASYDSYNPFDSLDVYPVRKQASVKLSRRLSLTLSTLTTIPTLFRPSSVARRTPPASRSQTSLSTIDTDDIHQFGLADDLSDTWGKISESRTSSADLPISPITFHIPTEIPPSSSSGDSKPTEVSTPFPTLTCSRSQSLASLQVRYVARTASRPDTPFDELSNLPIRVNRSGSNSTSIHQVTEPQLADVPSRQATSKTLNGQWNQDDMQEVIKKLRCLK